MASIARRTLMNLLFSAVDCIRCFLFRGIETSAFIPLHKEHRFDGFPVKGVIQKQEKYWNGMRTKTAKMLLNISQTVQDMQKSATVALITYNSITAPMSGIVLTAAPKEKFINKTEKDTICLEDISCSLIDSTPKYCYFEILSSNPKKSNQKTCGTVKLRGGKMSLDVDSFNDEDVATTIQISNIMCSRQRSYSESSDDNFICFVDDDSEENEDIDCKGSLGSSKNYGYYSNQYDTDTDYSSDDSTDDEKDKGYPMPLEKKVRFDSTPTVHVMRTWNFAYRSARKGEWENAARDRVRFQNRIQRAAACLDPILNPQHRQQIFENRFTSDSKNCCLQDSKTLDTPFLN